MTAAGPASGHTITTTGTDSPADPAPDGWPGGQAGDDLAGLLAALPTAQKIRLLTGADAWRTRAAGAIGLRAMITSDGPAGVRGVSLDERRPSSSLPCPSALGATWDTELAGQLAAALGAEARAKGVDVLLAPTVNLLRTPLGGRGFEFFGEDPVLTAALAVAYVRGLQGAGVAATVKHYIGNDSETQRWTYDARIGEQVLRELYLVPFEACVREAGAALVMAAYNKVNGSRMTEHGRLLREVLKDEWGFDGVVTSDWHAARSTTATALAALDLIMPGPDGPWGNRLAEAVRDGTVSEQVLDDKVLRLLRLAQRVGALDSVADSAPDRGGAPDGPADGPAAAGDAGRGSPVLALVDPGLLRRAVAASCVLLRNEGGLLPLRPDRLRRVAVTGPNAFWPTIQGGGSAGVSPVSVSRPADALAAALDGRAEVVAAPGCQTWALVPQAAAGSLRDPATGEPGLRLEFLAAGGSLLSAEHRDSAALAWWDGMPPGVGWGEGGSIVVTTDYQPAESGEHLIGAAGVGRLALSADDVLLADEPTALPADPVEAMTRPGEVRARARFEAGREVRLRLEFWPAADGSGPMGLRLGIVPAVADDDLIEAAVLAAASADVAVIVVGSAALTESEGFDRATLALPGRQDELIRRVAAVSAATVVVVNSGTPVLMPWAGQVTAVLQAWLPGQAMGEALADVLLGAAEPGGRLPVTLPAAEADCPVLHAVPDGDVLSYDEGLLIGYRGYDRSGIEPLYPFGHGLGYTTWAYESVMGVPGTGALRAPDPGGELELTVTVRNTGGRPGKEVVQAYLAGPPGDPADPGAAGAAAPRAPRPARCARWPRSRW